MQGGKGNRQNDTEHHPADGKAIWNNHMIQIDKGRADQKCNKDHAQESHHWRMNRPDPKKEHGSQQLDHWIANAEGCTAAAGFTPQ